MKSPTVASRFLLIDAGNTRIKWTTCDLGVDACREAEWVWRDALDTLVERWTSLRDARIDAVFVSNVAGSGTADAVRAGVSAVLGDVLLTFVVPTTRHGDVVNAYRDPSQLGPDRWAAALGAHALRPGVDLLVCGLGTATTIDLLARQDGRATFVGGMILPGIDAMRRSLARDTARLPIADGRVRDFADNTDDAIESGIVAAQIGAIRHAMEAAAKRAERPLECLLSGGSAPAIEPLLAAAGVTPLRCVPDLVLRGLRVIAQAGYDSRAAS